jgi:hypothetical protein
MAFIHVLPSGASVATDFVLPFGLLRDAGAVASVTVGSTGGPRKVIGFSQQ